MHRQMSGSAMVEYAMGLTFFIAVILAPVFSGQSALELLISAVKHEHAAYMHSSSMPL